MYCFTASTAFSSRPIPSGRTTWICCGLPCASTISDTRQMPWYFARRASSENSGSTEKSSCGADTPPPGSHQTAAVSAAFARSHSAAIAGADASALTTAEARAGTGALRGKGNLGRLRNSDIGHIGSVRQLDLLRHHDCGIDGKLGVVVADNLWWHDLRLGHLG